METIPKFLLNGGEISNIILRHDWSQTSLGPLKSWPQSLKTALNILIQSKFPMVLWWGRDLIQFYNDAYMPSLGDDGKHPAALGQKCEDCWPEAWQFISPLIQKVFNGESVFQENELVPIYRNGSIEDVYWTFSYNPVYDECDHVNGVFVVCNETTRQLETISKIKQSEERFQNLVREATVGIIVLIGEEMKVEIINAMYGRLINRTPEEMLGKRLFDIIPEAADPFLPLLHNVLRTGEPLYLYDQPYFIYTNGEKKEGYLNVVYQPYKDAGGSIAGVMALCHDITVQVLSMKKMEEAEAKARLAIDSAYLGTYEITYATDEMTTSDRFDEIWGTEHGLTRKEIVGRIHPEDIPGRQQSHNESIKNGNLHYEARIIWKDRSEHWVRVKGKILYDEKGNPMTLLGVVQDINEQKLFAERLTSLVNERTMELQRSNDDLLQFAHVTSHDLKEPVRKIKLFNARLQSEFSGLLPEKGKTYLAKVEHATGRILSMIEGVLSYSAISTSEQTIEPVDLNQIIKNIESDLEVIILQKNAVIMADSLPVVEGAAVLIYQLFYNVVNNALKFSMPETQPRISISASFIKQDAKNMARIVIADNGIGFDQEHAKKIFDTFTRLHSKDKFEGTGIGLALCKKIAERHGGNISAMGIKGSGATVIITLPLEQPNDHI